MVGTVSTNAKSSNDITYVRTKGKGPSKTLLFGSAVKAGPQDLSQKMTCATQYLY